MAKHTSTCRVCGREYQGFCRHGAGENPRGPNDESERRGPVTGRVSEIEDAKPREVVPVVLGVSPSIDDLRDLERFAKIRSDTAARQKRYRQRVKAILAEHRKVGE